MAGDASAGKGEAETGTNVPIVQVMMKDQYANYVVQKVMQTANPEQLQQLRERIQGQASLLKRFTYGKHILSRMDKITRGEHSSEGGGSSGVGGAIGANRRGGGGKSGRSKKKRGGGNASFGSNSSPTSAPAPPPVSVATPVGTAPQDRDNGDDSRN